MIPPEDWFDQFFTEEQQRKLAWLDQRQSMNQKKGMGEALQAFFSEVRLHLHQDIQDNEVQMLVDRWEALISQLTQGDPRLAASLDRAYAEVDESAPPEVQEWLQEMEEAVRFIQRAQAARHNPN